MEEAHHQYKRRCPVQGRVYSIDLSHHHDREGTSSVRMQVCNTEEAHHQYRRGCAVWIGYTVSTHSGVPVCRTELPKLLRGVFAVVPIWENDLLEKILLLLLLSRFHPTVVVSRCC